MVAPKTKKAKKLKDFSISPEEISACFAELAKSPADARKFLKKIGIKTPAPAIRRKSAKKTTAVPV